ncbi:DUF2586 domain-containing protein [Oscillospiraceae bacterium OttesenSCG-928-F05]|nr:DUF2586 domain-containing protein [Oscillospiraceae bacterium OttesenSCG-928-F05]
MLRDVITTVSDGLLGFDGEKGDGTHVKIGASPVESDKPIVISGNMTVSSIREKLGLCPLADKVMDSVENGASKILCIPVAPSVQGSIGAVTGVRGDGVPTGEITATGSPTNAFDVQILITGSGERNTGLFTYSIDGGHSFYDDVGIPFDGAFDIPQTGVKISFSEATSEEPTPFQAGDLFTFSTKAPSLSNAGVLDAVDKLRYIKEEFEAVHIVGEAQPGLWAAASEKQKELETAYHKPLAFVLEAYLPNHNEPLKDYAERLISDAKSVANPNVQIVAARALYRGMDGVTREVNGAGIVMGLYARAGVHQSIGRTASTAGMGISSSKMAELRPVGIEPFIKVLDEGRLLTFRTYNGLDGFFVTNARVASPKGSDYRYMEDVRVKNKIIREVRKAALPLLQDDIDLSDVQGELDARAKFLEEPLDKMATANEITSGSITVPEGQDILQSETMSVIIRYLSRGYIREIRVDIGRASAE